MKCFWLWLLSGCVGWAAVAVVRTTDGQELAGALELSGDRLIITPTNGAPSSLGLSNIVHGRFNLTNLPAAVKASAATTNASLPVPWVAQDIGPAGISGQATLQDGTFVLRGAGDSLWASRPDSFFFVYRPLRGDGQIVARLQASNARNAGLMIRDVNAPESLFAMMVYEAGDRLIYCNRRGERYRQQFQQEGDYQKRDFVGLPRFLKLRREGRELRGYLSWDDGVHWEAFFRGNVEMGSNILAGLFVMSGDATKTAEARFDSVMVTEIPANPDSRGSGSNLVSVVLRHGSALAGELVSADNTTVKLRRQGKVFPLAAPHVARILFGSPATSPDPELIPNRPGLLLDRNDFVDADFAGLEQAGIKVNSVLFGTRSYGFNQVKALVLRELAPHNAAYEVITSDGSVWRATAARLENGELRIEVPVLGSMRLPWADLSEIHRGGSSARR